MSPRRAERCEHCQGTGKCSCGDCGVWDGRTEWNDGLPRREKGVCKSCGGSGYRRNCR